MIVDIAKIDPFEWDLYDPQTFKNQILNDYVTANPIESVFDLEDPDNPPQFVHLVATHDEITSSIEVDLAKAWHYTFKDQFFPSDPQSKPQNKYQTEN